MYYQKVYPETEFLVCPSEADGINRRNWKIQKKEFRQSPGRLQES